MEEDIFLLTLTNDKVINSSKISDIVLFLFFCVSYLVSNIIYNAALGLYIFDWLLLRIIETIVVCSKVTQA